MELLDEIERVLGMAPVPCNWPVGYGNRFQGVVDLQTRRLLRYQRTLGGMVRSETEEMSIDDPGFPDSVGADNAAQLADSSALLAVAIPPFDRERFLLGLQTPVFFGSALNNFGVDCFLNALTELAPSPMPRLSKDGLIEADSPDFSAFVF
jgi:peptide chain release factor 3